MKPNKRAVEEHPSQTLARALLILEAFSAEQPEWGVRELARQLGINPATVYRTVATFYNFGYLERNPTTHRYSLGLRGIELARQYLQRNPLPKLASAIFEQYGGRFEHNFYLGALSHYELIYLAALDGRGPIKVVVSMGRAVPPHTTALGMVLLAFQTDEFIERFIEATGLPAFTPHTITQPAAFWRVIHQVRQQQYAINAGEHYAEVGAVGVPVYNLAEQVTNSVSLAYPLHLIESQRLKVSELIPLAREIAQAIGRLTL